MLAATSTSVVTTVILAYTAPATFGPLSGTVTQIEISADAPTGTDPRGLQLYELDEVDVDLWQYEYPDTITGARVRIPVSLGATVDKGRSIVLNDDGLPKLRISPTYKRLLDDKQANSQETRDYVKDKLRSALWLLPSSTPGAVSGYVLDGYGGLHPLGSAPAVVRCPYWQGWDIAIGLAGVYSEPGKSSRYQLTYLRRSPLMSLGRIH